MGAPRSVALTVLSAFAVASWAGGALQNADRTIPRDHFDSFLPLPQRSDIARSHATDAKTAFGRQLFFDRRLSVDQRLACNSAGFVAQFWDGCSPEVEALLLRDKAEGGSWVGW